MCDKCTKRKTERGNESVTERYTRVDNWFAGLTKTNKFAALQMCYEVQLSAMLGLNVGNGITAASNELDIAEAVMDSYITAAEKEPRLNNRRVDEVESSSAVYRLRDFIPQTH